jgi:hypothetical protein
VSLRFVEGATLVIDLKAWDAWRGALADLRLPWRRLRLEVSGNATLEIAPILASVPALRMLRVTFSGNGSVDWEDARAEQLELLVLANAGEVPSLDDAELPKLVELRLLGDSVASDLLRVSLRWSRLERVVVEGERQDVDLDADEDEDEGDDEDEDEGDDEEKDEDDEDEVEPIERPHRREPAMYTTAPTAVRVARPPRDDDRRYYDDEEEEPTTTAFFVVGQAIAPSLLTKLATRMSIAHLSARIATTRWLPKQLTIVQLFGTAEAELQPYGLALALHNVLENKPPIALVEIDADRAARFLVLDETQTRESHAGPDDVVRRALDLALGCDFGAGLVNELLDELAITPIDRLLGVAVTDQLTMIDPSSAPLVLPEEEEYDDDEDEDEDEYEDWDADDYDGMQASLEEPPPLDEDEEDDPPVPVTTAEIVKLKRTPAAETVVAVDAAEPVQAAAVEAGLDDADANAADDIYDEPEPEEPKRTEEKEDALVARPDRFEQWFEFRDHWVDRAVDIDDEQSEQRWPDPERANDIDLYFERQRAEPGCAKHARALEHCTRCDVLHCVECGGEDVCPPCFAAIIDMPPADDTTKRA